nr:LEAF RUST 10 DISEASE-RESISTANCE LOCUS RECEPTOR-LIKE PROTEIN KINASE-like 1.1 [Quercus suber]
MDFKDASHDLQRFVGCAVFFMILVSFIIWHLYKKKYASSNFFARNTYSDPSSRSEVEGGSVYFGVPVYSYSELEEATNYFDIEKELGNGGFGTVYHGKLHDGREVAVKRLYDHNYRRVQQFMNEIDILTRLRHKNLVSLYGCTSRHCRELLLVYEYIPNGTVADHIHGNQATPGSLTWPTRMSIAIETASALAYLHASDIIHRDIKTNNILLDDNFCVKVADFGLSRLFPNDVSHVSTAPQGTPGYVDPEYHQCYQLTSKSDVYSFGVVLIELISSLPAVDMFRHRHEINLANLALNKIGKCAFHELIDPYLGFESDTGVKTMTILVAKLAFQCLQPDKELRPSMDEALEALKNIQIGEDAPEDQEMACDDARILNVQKPASPDSDEVGLLRNKKPPPSPEAVTDNWTSRSTTPNFSGYTSPWC